MILNQKATLNKPKCPNTITFAYYLHIAAKLLIEPILSPHRHYLLSPFTHTRSHITLRLTSLPTRSHHLLLYTNHMYQSKETQVSLYGTWRMLAPCPLVTPLGRPFAFFSVLCAYFKYILCCVSFLHTLCHSASDATCQICHQRRKSATATTTTARAEASPGWRRRRRRPSPSSRSRWSPWWSRSTAAAPRPTPPPPLLLLCTPRTIAVAWWCRGGL